MKGEAASTDRSLLLKLGTWRPWAWPDRGGITLNQHYGSPRVKIRDIQVSDSEWAGRVIVSNLLRLSHTQPNRGSREKRGTPNRLIFKHAIEELLRRLTILHCHFITGFLFISFGFLGRFAKPNPCFAGLLGNFLALSKISFSFYLSNRINMNKI